MTNKPLVDDVSDRDIEVGEPKEWAAGLPGIAHAMVPAVQGIQASCAPPRPC